MIFAKRACICCVALWIGLMPGASADEMTEFVSKSVSAVGNPSRIGAVERVSIETTVEGGYRPLSTTYTVTASGTMKVVVGFEALVEGVTLIDSKNVQAANVGTAQTFSDLEKTELRCLARLFGGLFSLKNFNGELVDRGVKRYGPESHRVLEAQLGAVTAKFHLGADDHLIKRLVFESTDSDNGKIMSVYDFGPPQEKHGLRIPAFWYKTFIGPRDRFNDQHAITSLTLDPQVDEDFFGDLALHFGETTTAEGKLTGNVIGSVVTPSGNVVISTNWTSDHIRDAQLVSRDTIEIEIGAKKLPAVYLPGDSDFTGEDAVPGKAFLVLLDSGPFFSLVLFGESFKPIHDASTLLQPINVRRTAGDTGRDHVKNQSS